MDWTAPVDIYCERLDPSFWAEPLNAVTNLAFIIAAVGAALEARKLALSHLAHWWLIFLAFCIGVGSFLFHTFATGWAALADTLPIFLFVLSYAVIALMQIMGLRFWQALVATLVVMVLSGGALTLLPEGFSLNGSEQYFPALALMIIISIGTQLRGHPIRWWFTAATLTFMLSLTFRSLDMALCDAFPYGTHTFWHLLNATVIALLLQALLRHTSRISPP